MKVNELDFIGRRPHDQGLTASDAVEIVAQHVMKIEQLLNVRLGVDSISKYIEYDEKT